MDCVDRTRLARPPPRGAYLTAAPFADHSGWQTRTPPYSEGHVIYSVVRANRRLGALLRNACGATDRIDSDMAGRFSVALRLARRTRLLGDTLLASDGR